MQTIPIPIRITTQGKNGIIHSCTPTSVAKRSGVAEIRGKHKRNTRVSGDGNLDMVKENTKLLIA